MAGEKTTIFICGGENCLQRGSEDIHAKITEQIAAEYLSQKISIGRMFCMRMCGSGPNIMIAPEGELFSGVTCENVLTVLKPVFERAHQCKAE